MTRLELLRTAYTQYDTIYTGLILAAAWAAGTGHLLDWITHSRVVITIYWTMIIALFVIWILFIGLVF